MKLRVTALLALILAALAFTGSALAFDCIRVSSSLQGLQQSTRSGNWLLFDISSPAAAQQTAARLGEDVTLGQATCVADAYAASGLSPYFALGVGVAGRTACSRDTTRTTVCSRISRGSTIWRTARSERRSTPRSRPAGWRSVLSGV